MDKQKSQKEGSGAFTKEEQSAIKERAVELKRQSISSRNKKADGEQEVMDKIQEMEGNDRILAEQLHSLIKTTAPELSPRTWYGFPAYYRDGKLICYFQYSMKFKTRYATLGFTDQTNLDEGLMWPTVYAITEINGHIEKKISELIRKALS